MKNQKNLILLFFSLLFAFQLVNTLSLYSNSNIDNAIQTDIDQKFTFTPENLKLAQPSTNFSAYNLSIVFHEDSALVQGNLTVDFYNNDPHNFSQIPFHLYLSGMTYETRQGIIEIQTIYDYENQSHFLYYEVYQAQQLMWVNLTKELVEEERAKFVIQFNATLPDGPYDRANAHGHDYDQTRIFKFTGFYPIPCVYDQKDGWNIDPYLNAGDPFYFDVAYYNIFIEAPNETIIAATGLLEQKENKGATILYHFNPIYPVREVTFSASRYFQVESKIVNGVNLSTYYLPTSSYLWSTFALSKAESALLLYNSTFGLYPYPTLNIVIEYTSFGGMEYPCQVYATEAVDDYTYPFSVKQWILEKIIVHETCHQWWYNLVGNDEVDFNFLDEGLAVWSTNYYGEYNYGSWEYFQNVRHIDRVRTYYAETGLSSKVNQSAYEYIATNTDYVLVGYHKSPLILEKLRQLIGHNDFINGLKLYFEQYRYKHAVLTDLQKCFETIVDFSLDWFVFPWFDNPYEPRYAFESYQFDSATNNLTLNIEDLNEPLNEYNYRQLVPLAVYDNQGNEIYYDDIWINSTTIISIQLTQIPYKVSLLYNNYVVVQLDALTDLSLDLYPEIVSELIPGYDITIIVLTSVSLINVIISFKKRKIKSTKK